MGVPYTASVAKIPPTTAPGIYDPTVYEVIKPITMAINETVATPADVRFSPPVRTVSLSLMNTDDVCAA